MNNALFILTLSLVGIGIINNFIYLANVKQFFKLLKDKSPQQHQVLSTSIGASITSMNPGRLKTFWQYLQKADYNSLNDQRLTKLGNRIRFLMLSGIVIMTLFFVLLFTGIFTSH
ncbi:MAG: hypothetical protein ACXWLH_03125 [Candidatus Saccharimonadales bacterium]